jgi:hypothetical protein
VTVSSVTAKRVVLRLDHEVVTFLESVDGFGVHGGVVVGSQSYECRRGVLVTAGTGAVSMSSVLPAEPS